MPALYSNKKSGNGSYQERVSTALQGEEVDASQIALMSPAPNGEKFPAHSSRDELPVFVDGQTRPSQASPPRSSSTSVASSQPSITDLALFLCEALPPVSDLCPDPYPYIKQWFERVKSISGFAPAEPHEEEALNPRRR